MSKLLDIVLYTICHLLINQNERNEHVPTVFWCVHEQLQEKTFLHVDVVKGEHVLQLKLLDKVGMLSRAHRISRRDFELVYKQKRTLFHECVSFAYCKKKSPTPSQFTCVVSKKVARKAVQRNIIRRQVYGILAQYMKSINNGYMGVFYIKKGFSELSHQEKNNIVLHMLEKSHILNQDA